MKSEDSKDVEIIKKNVKKTEANIEEVSENDVLF